MTSVAKIREILMNNFRNRMWAGCFVYSWRNLAALNGMIRFSHNDVLLFVKYSVHSSKMCYVFSVVSYGCETWTFSKAIDHKINAFEMWCYRRMLRISWTSENWCERNNYVKQPEKPKVVLCGPNNNKHIRTL